MNIIVLVIVKMCFCHFFIPSFFFRSFWASVFLFFFSVSCMLRVYPLIHFLLFTRRPLSHRIVSAALFFCIRFSMDRWCVIPSLSSPHAPHVFHSSLKHSCRLLTKQNRSFKLVHGIFIWRYNMTCYSATSLWIWPKTRLKMSCKIINFIYLSALFTNCWE